MKPNEEMAAHLRQLRVICMAIPAGVALFAGVVWYLLESGSFQPPMAGEGAYLGNLLNLVALSILVIAHFLPVLMKVPGRDAPGEALLAWHRTSTIVAFAAREAAAFMALAGALLTGELGWSMAVVGLAVTTMILAWPKASQLEALTHR